MFYPIDPSGSGNRRSWLLDSFSPRFIRVLMVLTVILSVIYLLSSVLGWVYIFQISGNEFTDIVISKGSIKEFASMLIRLLWTVGTVMLAGGGIYALLARPYNWRRNLFMLYIIGSLGFLIGLVLMGFHAIPIPQDDFVAKIIEIFIVVLLLPMMAIVPSVLITGLLSGLRGTLRFLIKT